MNRREQKFTKELETALKFFSIMKFRKLLRDYFPEKLDEFETLTSAQKRVVIAKMALASNVTTERTKMEAEAILAKFGY